MAKALKKQRRLYHHGALKKGLVGAASMLIKKNGHVGFNLRDLAKECQVSAPAVYRHFSSKNALMVAIAEAGFKNILSKLKTELPLKDEVDAKERLVCLGEIYVQFAIENEGEFRVMFSRELCQIPEYKLIEPLASEAFVILKELISEVLPKHISETDRQNGVMKSWALVHGLASLRIDGNVDDLSQQQFYKMVRSVLNF
ncbi:MAG: TetR/AcrR family transcriptional regulator [Bdellovibrionales bacterium]|nr:TetR/AcrR family transcriptional regulator [Bdellovibrionales bacterium]